jgi:hypothetical protein
VNTREEYGFHAISLCVLAASTIGTSAFVPRTGTRNLKSAVAARAPATCAAMKPGASAGRIPENVFVSERAKVTAGFAKEVDDVNQ